MLTAGSALALAGLSAWLITKAWTMPPVLTLSLAVTAVRALGITRGLMRYVERLATHRVALAGLTEIRVALYRSLSRAAPSASVRLSDGELLARTGTDVDALGDSLVRTVIPRRRPRSCPWRRSAGCGSSTRRRVRCSRAACCWPASRCRGSWPARPGNGRPPRPRAARISGRPRRQCWTTPASSRWQAGSTRCGSAPPAPRTPGGPRWTAPRAPARSRTRPSRWR
ncbi:hypothetical protein [Tsukamurella sp. PLM1]|uniref:hypothetical protein n=1 Tax=Tsukamurella sp. PLM1 TaxID=2929795 RepID=UPI0020BF4D37|nr:hypothetical protein [Tsukamurella sp. PLM1]